MMETAAVLAPQAQGDSSSFEKRFQNILEQALSKERELWQLKTDTLKKEITQLNEEVRNLKVAIWGEEVIDDSITTPDLHKKQVNVPSNPKKVIQDDFATQPQQTKPSEVVDNGVKPNSNFAQPPGNASTSESRISQPGKAYREFINRVNPNGTEEKAQHSVAPAALKKESKLPLHPQQPAVPPLPASNHAPSDSVPAVVQNQPNEPHYKTGGEQKVSKNKVRAASVCEEVATVFKQLKIRRKYRFAIFKIEGDQITVEKTGPPQDQWQDFAKLLPYTDCRFAIYDHAYKTLDDRQTNKLLFICWFPTNSSSHNKMAYTDGKGLLRDHLQGVLDVSGRTIEELEVAVGIRDEDEEDSDIDFDS